MPMSQCVADARCDALLSHVDVLYTTRRPLVTQVTDGSSCTAEARRAYHHSSAMSVRSSTTTAAGPSDSSGLTQRKPIPAKEDFFNNGNNGKLMPYVMAAHEERYSILDRRMVKERKTLAVGFLKTLVLITLILWIALPIFCT